MSTPHAHDSRSLPVECAPCLVMVQKMLRRTPHRRSFSPQSSLLSFSHQSSPERAPVNVLPVARPRRPPDAVAGADPRPWWRRVVTWPRARLQGAARGRSTDSALHALTADDGGPPPSRRRPPRLGRAVLLVQGRPPVRLPLVSESCAPPPARERHRPNEAELHARGVVRGLSVNSDLSIPSRELELAASVMGEPWGEESPRALCACAEPRSVSLIHVGG